MYLIGGTMGIGKTTVSQLIKVILPNSVFLDGYWYWDMYPFQATNVKKRLWMIFGTYLTALLNVLLIRTLFLIG